MTGCKCAWLTAAAVNHCAIENTVDVNQFMFHLSQRDFFFGPESSEADESGVGASAEVAIDGATILAAKDAENDAAAAAVAAAAA